MKKLWTTCLIALLLPAALQAQYTTSKSHIVSYAARKAGYKTTSTLTSGSYQDVSVAIQYYDRLGRPIQSIARQASPLAKDMVSFHQYNSDGLKLKNYLPYVSVASNGLYRSGALSEQANFYNPSAAVNYGKSTDPWAEVDIEESPLKRVLEQGGIGTAYQLNGYTTRYVYGLNTATDNVLNWELKTSGGLRLAKGAYFSANKLDVITVKDPDWVSADGNVGTTKTFTDYLGRTILSRTYNSSTEIHDTYYVYDDLGNLRYIIPPEAVREALNGNTDQISYNRVFATSQAFPSGKAKNLAYYYMPGVEITLNPSMEFTDGFSLEPYPIDDEFLAKWIFINEYDDHNRLITKKVPGAEAVHYVYDKSGRLILSQDGNQRLTDQWTFTKYDRFDRPVLTGNVTDRRGRDALAAYVATEITSTGNKWYEERGTAVHGYTNRVFPYVSNANHYLVVSYYDDYDFKSAWASTYNHQTNGVNSDTPEASPLGQETGGKIKVLGSTTWLKSVKYYDEDGLLIQGVADHHMGDVERFYAAYNFVGDLTQSRMEHVIDANKTVSISERFAYDHAGRLLKHWHSVDDEPEILLAENKYNELGENIETNLHYTPPEGGAGGAYIQSIDSRYDVQGRLTHINNAQRSNDGIYNGDSNDQFGMELYYDSSPAGFTFPTRHNGNLRGITWSNATMNGVDQRGFGYTYDRTNRLTAATYKEKDNGSWSTKVGHFDMGIGSYDYNGNIKNLTRKATISGTATTIDNLTYSYNGNQLQAVNDATTRDEGFKDGAELSTEYTYDANGNMITDSNKLITGITYNQLNRPEVITFSSGDKITYTYDASGARLKQQVTVSGQLSQTYDYSGGLLFDNAQLAEVSQAYGRLKVDVVGNDYTYDYQYFLNDHLGNTRAMIAPLERKYVAGMESDRADQEEAQFLYVDETRYTGQSNTGTKSSMLNAAASPAKVLGPAKGFKVYNGDQVDMEVWAKYTNTTGASETAVSNMLLSALSAAFGVSSGSSGEALQIYNGFNSAIGTSVLFNQAPGDIPEANLNYLFFDTNYNFISGGAVQVNSTSYTKLTNTFTANQDGYIFIYLANESTLNVNVYFDDLKITHTSSDAVLQADDYYPFGLPMNNNFLEAGVSANRFLYQGKEWQTELGLNLYDFHARQFDPALGRFLSVDPQNQFGSPYLGMGNLPTITVDPDGELAWLAAAFFGAKAILDYSNARQNGLNGFQSFLYAGLNLALSAASAALGDVSGALPNALLHAGVNVASNGVSNIALGQPFFNNWQFSAIVGGVTGGIRGHRLAGKDPYRNNWTGTRNWKAIRANQPKVSWPTIEPSQVSLKGVGGLPRPETTTLPKAIDFNAIFEGPDLGEFVVEAARPRSYFDIAQAFEGAPYQWEGMTKEGIDCSGLVCAATGHERSAWWTGQEGSPPGSWKSVNARTSSAKDFFSDAKKGDLFVWKNKGHAAFYAGKNSAGTHMLFHAEGIRGINSVGYTATAFRYVRDYGYPDLWRQVFK